MTTSTVAATGAWTTADDLPTPASWYGQHDGAAVLTDGTVLVAGGADGASAALDKAAVYDPAANTWQAVGVLHTPRQLHTITRLADGKVLVTGGLSGSSAAGPGLASAELYDPQKKTWTATDGLVAPRWNHSAALLPDGTVLVAGGSTVRSGRTTTALRSAERYNPTTGKWTAARDMTDARTGHTAVSLADGTVLVCGGVAPVGAADDPALAFCELYDPQANRWAPTGSLLRGRRHHQATRLSGGTVLITGGTAPGSPGAAPYDPFSQRSAERYDLATGIWTAVAEMPAGRAFHRAVRIGAGPVLVAGGAASDRDEAGYRSAVIHSAADDTAAWALAGGLATGRWAFAAAVLPDNRVLVTGGVVRSGLAAADPAVTELTAGTELFATTPVAGSGS